MLFGTALLSFIYIGIRSRSTGGDFKSKYLGGGKLPWWVAGTSMVATTFAADTPLAVAELVHQGGIAQNWLWWSFVFGGVLTAVIFAPLWKRSGVNTELEFITFRYSGKAAMWLRQFKSVYLGLFMNVFILGWVNLAMHSIAMTILGCTSTEAYFVVFGLFVLSAVYTYIGGLRGVAYADVLQFVLAMTGCIVLAVIVVNNERVGGVDGLMEKLPEHYFNFFPELGSDQAESSGGWLQLTYGAFLAFFAVQWWASWYPGAEPGGGGYVAQRFLGTDNESEAKKATMLFQIGHYCLRPWPWILVGLCAVALYSPSLMDIPAALSGEIEAYLQGGGTLEALGSQPFLDGVANKEALLKAYQYQASPRLGFVYAMTDFLPSGLLGLLVVAFLAAYMSTIGTQLNWGASYLFKDLVEINYPKATQDKPKTVSLLIQVVLVVVGMTITWFIDSISGVWSFVLECGSGLGLVLILRWFWSRINVYSEISATIAPLLFYTIMYALRLNWPFDPELLTWMEANKVFFFINVVLTTVVWIAVTFLTQRESDEVLQRFVAKVQPPFGNWKKYGEVINPGRMNLIGTWIIGVCVVLSTLFAIGGLFFDMEMAIGCSFTVLFGGIGLWKLMK